MSFQTFLSLTLLGLAGGALYGMLGTGVTVFYRATGVINFAMGAIAMYTAFVYDDLVLNGRLVFPWIEIGFIPSGITVSDTGVPKGIAIAAGLAMAAAIGAGTYLLIFRPLRNSSALARLIASVGLMLYLQATAQLNFGVDARRPESVLPGGVVTNFLGLGAPMPTARLWMVAITLAIAFALVVFYRYTRSGKATRAVASNEKGAVLLGYSRVWLGVLSGALSALVAGIAGILISPVTNLDSINLTLFIVPALAAALVGKLSAPVLTAVAGIALGLFQNAAVVAGGFEWFPEWLRSGAREFVPFLVIVVVLFLRADRIPDRSVLANAALPESPVPRHPLRAALVWGVALGTLVLALDGTWQFALTTTLITAVLMLSYVVIVGYVGQISVAQLALAGVAAFALTRFGIRPEGSTQDTFGLPFPLAALVAVAVATGVGVLVGLPALRLRGQQLVVVTMAGAIAISTMLFNNHSVTGVPLGGTAAAPEATFGPIDVSVRDVETGLSDRWQFGAFAMLVLVLVSYAVARIRSGRTGRRFLAVRSNERAAAACGINVARTKLLAFAISSAIAGCGGVLIAVQQSSIEALQFDVFAAIVLLALVTIGGIAALSGAYFGGMIAAGGLVAYFMKVNLHGLEKYIPLIGAVTVMLQIVLAPSGIVVKTMHDVEHLRERLAHRKASRAGTGAGGPPTDATDPEPETAEPVPASHPAR